MRLVLSWRELGGRLRRSRDLLSAAARNPWIRPDSSRIIQSTSSVVFHNGSPRSFHSNSSRMFRSTSSVMFGSSSSRVFHINSSKLCRSNSSVIIHSNPSQIVHSLPLGLLGALSQASSRSDSPSWSGMLEVHVLLPGRQGGNPGYRLIHQTRQR